ncbi:DEAD-box ATP-dependent RNA helicase 17 [Acorus calamus]|uniref:ATP-dependent RNA helicase n=1 Tax=Acorus calamus TaxID=4465 RepID=A0AAV9E4J7_ACOCL|nr:DEAD-box ATP-dependent RNA helicase 17 [Acorus calamus]
MLINSATGTGKTMVYIAPIINYLQLINPRISRSDGTYALVVVPTQELCMQVYNVLQKLLHRFHWIVPGYLMGGENRAKEKARLRKGISILVATPGRLLDHLNHTASFSYVNLRWVIFDEADRILELGLTEDIKTILHLLGSRQNMNDSGQNEGLGEKPSINKRHKVAWKNASISKENEGATIPPHKRQNLLLSATLSEKVNHLARISLENPVLIGPNDKFSAKQPSQSGQLVLHNGRESNQSDMSTSCTTEDYNLPSELTQRYVRVSCGSRLPVLLSILKNLFEQPAPQKVVVFFSTCDTVDFHYSLFSDFQWPSDSQLAPDHKETFLKCKIFRLHGKMDHNARKTTFNDFSSEKSALLLCTDVAARGLDIPRVKCIIQYDSPGEATEYVHRVGRTARLGEKGEALLFLQPVETEYLDILLKHCGSLEEFPLIKILNRFPVHGRKHQNRNMLSLDSHPWISSLQKALESFIATEPEMTLLAKDGFCSWLRAYAAHRGELKRMFVVKKLHLGHVAKSFGLKEQPTSIGGSFLMQVKKRKKYEKRGGLSKRKRFAT